MRGYRKRGKIFMQLLAENVYASAYSYRGAEGRTVKDLFPLLFKDEDDKLDAGLTEDDRQELQELMQNFKF